MALPLKENITILQGATFNRVLRWDEGTPVFKAITNVEQNAPATITCVGHGVPEGWPVAVVSVKGMTQINTANPDRVTNYSPASVVDVDTLILPYVDASSYKKYTGGGYIRYRKPVDLTGFTARMMVKKNKQDLPADALVSLTSGSGIIVDNSDKTITITIDASVTETLDVQNAVYDLELVSAGGQVYRLVEGTATISKEATN